jgi:phospho-N-acetylmuramoyl-pentapeptide-transferase
VIEWLTLLLADLGVRAGAFRLFGYLSFRLVMAALTALVLTLVFGHRVIVGLYRAGLRDTGGDHASLRVDSKRGTPTAGGLLIVGSTLASLALWGRWSSYYLLAAVAALAWFGLVGLFDDWLKVRLQSGLFGLGQAAKTVLQLLFAVPFACWLVSSSSPLPPGLRSTVLVPFARHAAWEVAPWAFAAFVILAFYAIVNAVNITDGLDGLAAGPSALTATLYGVYAYVLGNAITSRYLLFEHQPGVGELAVFAGALVGALSGFLWFNAYPAEVFMGDTGSMAVGASLATMAFLTRQELLFPLAGGVFVATVFTSLVQQKIGDRVGRRIFLRAPIHHSWVHRGVAEPKVVIRTWIVAVMLTLAAALSLKLR